MDDIIDALRDDHANHRALFERLCETNSGADVSRASLLATLDRELRLHMRFEEDVLFPALRAHADKDTRGQTLEAYAEHEAARATLKELESVATSDEMWGAWLKVLKEELEHHMKEEEEDLLPRAKDLIDAEDRRAMAEELARRKSDAQAAREAGSEREAKPHHIPLVGLH